MAAASIQYFKINSPFFFQRKYQPPSWDQKNDNKLCPNYQPSSTGIASRIHRLMSLYRPVASRIHPLMSLYRPIRDLSFPEYLLNLSLRKFCRWSIHLNMLLFWYVCPSLHLSVHPSVTHLIQGSHRSWKVL